MSEWPDETTDLFIAYYTGKYVPTKMEEPHPQQTVSPPPSISGALTSAVDMTAKYVQYLPYMTDRASTHSSNAISSPSMRPRATATPAEPTQPRIPQYQPPRPRAAFSLFIDFPQQLIQFLESLMDDDSFATRDQKDVDDICTTLFEAYLQAAKTGKEGRSYWEEKATTLLTKRNLPVDTALLLSYLASFSKGTRIVRERTSLQIDIFRSYTEKRDTKAAIEALHEYGPNEPELYILALRYFCSDPDILEVVEDELLQVLKRIEDDKLLTPLQIVQALSQTKVAHLGVVKDFLAETIAKERRDIENVRLSLGGVLILESKID